MDYELIATLGPNSDGEPTWQAMLVAGATGFRLNTSHLSLLQLNSWVERLGAFRATQDTVPPLVLDLQGSKWRLGQFPECVLAVAASALAAIATPILSFRSETVMCTAASINASQSSL